MTDIGTRAASTGRLTVNYGDVCDNVWANTLWDQSANCFASILDRDTQWPSPHDGALAYTAAENNGTLWLRQGGAWAPVASPGKTPVTTGGLVSATDLAGTVWVAMPGVNGGNWRQARDVLHSRVYRASAFTMAATAPLSLDGVTFDAYSLYQPANNAFVAPLTGMYQFYFQIALTSPAANNLVQVLVVQSGSGTLNIVSVNLYTAAATGNPTAFGSGSAYLAAGDLATTQTRSGASATGFTGPTNTFATMDYLGTG